MRQAEVWRRDLQLVQSGREGVQVVESGTAKPVTGGSIFDGRTGSQRNGAINSRLSLGSRP